MEAVIFMARVTGMGRRNQVISPEGVMPSRQKETHRHGLGPQVIGRPSCLVNLIGGMFGGQGCMESRMDITGLLGVWVLDYLKSEPQCV